MSENKQIRRRVYVNPKIQGRLILRVVLYWIVCAISVTLMLLCWQVLSGPPQPFFAHLNMVWYHYGPAIVCSCLLLPLVIIDILGFSNRFVGPMLRLRRSMHELALGEQVEPLEFREGDFWPEFADEFNALARRMENQPAEDDYYSYTTEEDDEPVAVG